MPDSLPPFGAAFEELQELVRRCVERITPGRQGFLAWEQWSFWALEALEWRFYGVRRHYGEIYAPTLDPLRLWKLEYQLSTILFHMQSSIETIAFALNGLGSAVEPGLFIDASKRGNRVSPLHLYSDRNGRKLQPGYAIVFPSVQRFWRQMDETALLDTLREMHNRSKHCRMVSALGRQESLPAVSDPAISAAAPWQDVYLWTGDGLQVPERYCGDTGSFRLTPLVEHYVDFVNATGAAAVRDATTNILPRCVPQPG